MLVTSVSGALTAVAAPGNAVGNVKIFGIATMSAADSLGTGIPNPVAVARQQRYFILPAWSATPSLAVLAASNLDNLVAPLRVLSDSTIVADIDGIGTNNRVVLREIFPGDAGVQYGWGIWEFLRDFRQADNP